MKYREITEAGRPLQERIIELATLLNGTAMLCSRGANPNSSVHTKYFLQNADDFLIFQNFQKELSDKIAFLEKELETSLNKQVD